jgi:hypothetical protein
MDKLMEKEFISSLSEHQFGIRETVDEAVADARRAFEIYRDLPFAMRKKNNRQYKGLAFS